MVKKCVDGDFIYGCLYSYLSWKERKLEKERIWRKKKLTWEKW